MASQVEAWFKLADQDGDGAVGGAEAVRFFTRSGLPQDVLGQVSHTYEAVEAALENLYLGQAVYFHMAPPQATEHL